MWTPVTSSVIAAIDYNVDQQTLYVKFKLGPQYNYYPVPLRIYQELLAAPSKGRYLNLKIKPFYTFEKAA